MSFTIGGFENKDWLQLGLSVVMLFMAYVLGINVEEQVFIDWIFALCSLGLMVFGFITLGNLLYDKFWY